MRINDAIIGGVLLAFAILVFAYARTLPAIPGQEYGAAVFPVLIAVGLGACAALMIATGLRHWAGAVMWGQWARTHHAWLNLVITFGLVLFYILASSWLGFVPVSVVILLALLIMMGTRWWVAVPVAIVATLLIQQTFAGLLRVPLPLGLLGP
jgi:putative tricarboxylic transport membrane protein